ncbi:MAG: hypothetical protein MJZ92_05905 [Paludibacteraceae bacterium]|nr:hypothetical protein [Paludibacteraceae bacterium]
MSNQSIEMSLLEPDEREEIEYIYNLIPEQDRRSLTQDDILFVLDEIDNFLEDKGLLVADEQSGEVTYLDGDIDETEQLEYILAAAKRDCRSLTSAQVQLILDGEEQYGIEQGWYEEED